jgi:adenosylhomocysteinase
LAVSTRHEYLEKIARFFPLLELVADHLSKSGVFTGARVGWHCHLTELTAAAVQALIKAGAKVYLSECNSATTDDAAVEVMREAGAQIYLGADSAECVLVNDIDLISDTGFALIRAYLDQRHRPLTELQLRVLGACEITTSGITKLNEAKDVNLPVININSGALKHRIENFHGVGEGVIEAFSSLIGRSPSGMNCCVLGYGPVGAGAAFYLRRSGASVTVIEKDPVRELIAHYDGFKTKTIKDAVAEADMLVTATGQASVIRRGDWQKLKHGAIVMNVGHSREELELSSLEAMAVGTNAVGEYLCEFLLPSEDGALTKSIYVCTNGDPTNVVLLTGSVEPTIIHLATELMTLAYLRQNAASLKSGENPLPYGVERAVSLLALHVLQSERLER